RTKPEPRSNRLAGSGAGVGEFPVVMKNVSGPPLAPEIVEDNPKISKPALMATWACAACVESSMNSHPDFPMPVSNEVLAKLIGEAKLPDVKPTLPLAL